MRILLGVSGGVAAYKAVLLLRLLREQGHRVRVVPTASALRFVGAPTFEALSGERSAPRCSTTSRRSRTSRSARARTW